MKRLIMLVMLATTTAATAQDIRKSDVVRPAGSPVARYSTGNLVKLGDALFSDKRLSTNDMSCASCHAGLQAFNDTFKASYPHMVQMAKDMAGLDSVSAETMVEFCMIVPMSAKPFAWNSIDLAALTAYL